MSIMEKRMLVNIDYNKVDFVTREKTEDGFLTMMITFKNGDVLAYLYKELKDFMKDASTFAHLGFLDTIGV